MKLKAWQWILIIVLGYFAINQSGFLGAIVRDYSQGVINSPPDCAFTTNIPWNSTFSSATWLNYSVWINYKNSTYTYSSYSLWNATSNPYKGCPAVKTINTNIVLLDCAQTKNNMVVQFTQTTKQIYTATYGYDAYFPITVPKCSSTPVCTPSVSCTYGAWSDSANSCGTRTKTCTDANGCSATTTTTETKTCPTTCTPSCPAANTVCSGTAITPTNGCGTCSGTGTKDCTAPCVETCSSLQYICGVQTICGQNVNCGTCSMGVCVNGKQCDQCNNDAVCGQGKICGSNGICIDAPVPDCNALRTTLNSDIQKYLSGTITRAQLGSSIMAWVNC